MLPVAAETSTEGESGADLDCRVEGEFLRALVERLQPMLRQSMRSRRIKLATDAYGAVALKSDGVFVHVDIADQEDALSPMLVLRAEPNLVTILGRIEGALISAHDAQATQAASIVREALASLEGAVPVP